jgi:hypothetical protein
MDEMTVFELLAREATNTWASRGSETRIGLYSTAEKAEAKIEEIKQEKSWYMDWESFRVVPVEVI